jgi:hypothetical protein
MKSSTWPIREPDGFGCFRQIVTHLGGMTRACLRHRPIHFAFHWRGICRAITLDSLERGGKSIAQVAIGGQKFRFKPFNALP